MAKFKYNELVSVEANGTKEFAIYKGRRTHALSTLLFGDGVTRDFWTSRISKTPQPEYNNDINVTKSGMNYFLELPPVLCDALAEVLTEGAKEFAKAKKPVDDSKNTFVVNYPEDMPPVAQPKKVAFSLEKYNSGLYNVVTRDGRSVNIKETNRLGTLYQISGKAGEDYFTWMLDGRHCIADLTPENDLFLIPKTAFEYGDVLYSRGDFMNCSRGQKVTVSYMCSDGLIAFTNNARGNVFFEKEKDVDQYLTRHAINCVQPGDKVKVKKTFERKFKNSKGHMVAVEFVKDELESIEKLEYTRTPRTVLNVSIKNPVFDYYHAFNASEFEECFELVAQREQLPVKEFSIKAYETGAYDVQTRDGRKVNIFSCTHVNPYFTVHGEVVGEPNFFGPYWTETGRWSHTGANPEKDLVLVPKKQTPVWEWDKRIFVMDIDSIAPMFDNRQRWMDECLDRMDNTPWIRKPKKKYYINIYRNTDNTLSCADPSETKVKPGFGRTFVTTLEFEA